MLFKEVIGNNSLREQLIRQYSTGKVSHAQLFTGPTGFGTLPLAMAFAQYLLCHQPNEHDACGVCASCLKAQKLVHPDLHFVFPVATTTKVPSKPLSEHFLIEWREAYHENPYMQLSQWLEFIGADKKQGNIAAEESNTLIKKAALKPFEGDAKVFVLWMADKMSTAASNKILKLIEEPTPNTFFILVTETTENLLPTVLSRVQLTKVRRIEEGVLKSYLQDHYEMAEDLANKISLMADGSFSEARKLAGTDTHEDFYFDLFTEWVRLCFKVNIPDIIQWVDKVAALGREKQKYFFVYALTIFRESLLQNYHVGELSRMMGKEAAFKDKFAPFVNRANALSLIEEMNRASYHIERNANPKVVFLDLSLKVVKLLKSKM